MKKNICLKILRQGLVVACFPLYFVLLFPLFCCLLFADEAVVSCSNIAEKLIGKLYSLSHLSPKGPKTDQVLNV